MEYRSEKHTANDTFQIQYAIERISKTNGMVKKGIDKSAFRKSIGRKLSLQPGESTVNYIVENLYLRVYESEDVEFIKSLEKELIVKHQPKFNTTYKTVNAYQSHQKQCIKDSDYY